MRVFIGEFRQESNSFNPVASSLAFWDKSGRYEGEAMRQALEGKPCAVGGMIHALEESGEKTETVFGISMSCQSGGPAEQEVMDLFLDRTLAIIRHNPSFDLVLLSFHGALQTMECDDAEGEVAEKIRQAVGEETIISVSTDLHAFISPKLLNNVDAIAGYHTYPHIDFFQTGVRAAKLGLAALGDGPPRPYTACVQLPLLVPASVYNTLDGVFKEIIDCGYGMVNRNELLDFSVYPMQPWLDVQGGASCVLAVADSREKAASKAQELADLVWKSRYRFAKELKTIDEVIAMAKQSAPGNPVVLVDSADSCNAGSSGDSMAVAGRILALAPGIKAATVVNDSRAADRAHMIGVGKKALFKLGGDRDPRAESIEVEGYVKSLHDGSFEQEGPAGRGQVNEIGPTAVIRVGNLDVIVCHWMAGNGDLQLYRAFGIEPTLYDLVVVKACTSFRAGYSKISTRIYDTDTPGAATANLTSLAYRKIPNDFYPWSEREDFTVEKVLFCRERAMRKHSV